MASLKLLNAVQQKVNPSEQAKGSIFQKTRLCKFFSNGLCARGGECRFAHGIGELHNMPDLTNTKLCPLLRDGHICDRPDCRYAHTKDQVRRHAFAPIASGVLSRSLPTNAMGACLDAATIRKLGAQHKGFNCKDAVTKDFQSKSKTLDGACQLDGHTSETLDDFMFRTDTLDDFGDFVRNWTETTHIRSDDGTFTRQSSECFTRQSSEDTSLDRPLRKDDEEGVEAEQEEHGEEEQQEGEEEAKEEEEDKGEEEEEEKEEEEEEGSGSEASDESLALEQNLGSEGVTQDGNKGNAAHGGAAPLNLSIFHKTKMCRFHQEGGCKRGAKCRFAHGSTELQPLPDLCQTKVCPMIEAGESCEDPECSFAHSSSELRALSGSEIKATSNDGLKPHRDDFYKTKMCKFHLKGSCLRGANCRYAHDSISKRPLPDLRCTRMCPTLTQTGLCKDTWCSFAHVIREVTVLQGMEPELHEANRYKLVEKGTFLEWEPVVPILRRCASAPGSIGTQ